MLAGAAFGAAAGRGGGGARAGGGGRVRAAVGACGRRREVAAGWARLVAAATRGGEDLGLGHMVYPYIYGTAPLPSLLFFFLAWEVV